MALSDKSQIRKIEGMSDQEKDIYFASGHVTIAPYSELAKDGEGKPVSKIWWVAKIRGVIVGDPREWRHETPEAAREYGREVLKQWKDELK